MKGKITSEYISRVNRLCISKLNGANLIDGINTWAVGVVRYSAGIVDWTMEEVANLDRGTTKILAMNGCLVCINDLPNCLRLTSPRMFANITFAASTFSDLENGLNSELRSLNLWLISNKLS